MIFLKPHLDSAQEHNFHPVYRPDIDGLRAIAILSVVIFHAFPSLLQGGFVGVDIFFVISGFLISSIIFKSLWRNDFSFAEFYAHRVKRIFPALILVLIVAFALGWFILLPDEYAQLGKHMAAGAGFVQNFVLWKEDGYFNTASELKPLMHLWSLAIEEQFYLLYPLLIWLIWRFRLNLLIIVLVLALVSFGLNVASVADNVVMTFFLPHTRFWELLAGAILAYLQLFKLAPLTGWLKRWVLLPSSQRNEQATEKSTADLNNVLSVVGFALIVGAVLALNRDMLFPGWWALLPVLGAWLLILAGPQAWVNRTILASRLMVFVGLISYPLYLWHWTLLSFARIVTTEQPPADVRIAAVALSFFLAWLTFHLIEKPIRFGSKSWIKTASLSLIIVVVGYGGYNSYTRGGLDFRFNKILSQLSSTHFDIHESWRQDVCFLMGPGIFDFGTQCIDSNHQKTLFLWGDSHAAALYPGLDFLHKQRGFGLTQLTASGCLPSIEQEGNKRCQQINLDIFSILKKTQPKTIVLHANWASYPDPSTHILATIRHIRSVTKSRIILVGPVPLWREPMPKLYWVYWRKQHDLLPQRTFFELSERTAEVDKSLHQISVENDVEYFSAYQAMCNAEGCLTRVGNDNREPTTFDDGHLTPAASLYLIQNLSTHIALP